MTNHIPIILLSRYSSSRLPGKALMKINNVPLLGHIINKFEKSFGENWGLVATSTESSDDLIEEYCLQRKSNYYRGSLENVALRFLEAAEMLNSEYVIRITGDSLFIDTDIIAEGLDIVKHNHYDIVSNRMLKMYPVGQTIEIVRVEYYKSNFKYFNKPGHFEHVTSYFYEEKTDCKFFHMTNARGTFRENSHAIDTLEDMNLAKQLFSKFPSDIYSMNYLEIETELVRLKNL